MDDKSLTVANNCAIEGITYRNGGPEKEKEKAKRKRRKRYIERDGD